ncbi:MAG: DUF4384 domain-containing protein [Planctomycetia bacterium]|nr:DUF4384 domain-containing protein [Planctomycetia bacterium]
MKNYLTFSLVLLAVCTTPCLAFADVDEAQAQVAPWSGYWWPHHEGRLHAAGAQSPLGKYDAIATRQALPWERKTHPAGDDVPHWHGYCHAWAASAVLEAEPRQARRGMSSSHPDLRVGDQKGLLAVSHAMDVANHYGDRFGDEEGDEDADDLAPDVLWQLLKLYVQQQRVPLILDVDAGPEVWNFPVYAYRVEYTPRGESGQHEADLTLWMADDAVPPDYVGIRVRKLTYRFAVRMQGASVVLGSGRWLGPSAKDHPDFAWYPLLAEPENPEIDYSKVKEILGSPTATPPTTSPTTPPATAPTTPPTSPTTPTPPVGTIPPTATAPDSTGGDAQPIVLGPMELVALVANKTSSFKFDVTVDRFDGGKYTPGEAFSIRGVSAKAGYLYLLHLDGQGELKLLFPEAGQDNRVAAGKEFQLPGAGQKFTFRTSETVGTQRVKAVVTSRPLSFSGADMSQQNRPEAGQQRPFRLHPTQRRQIEALLADYQQGKEPSGGQLTGQSPQKLLGEFAQDEVAIYVGPKDKTPRPRKP